MPLARRPLPRKRRRPRRASPLAGFSGLWVTPSGPLAKAAQRPSKLVTPSVTPAGVSRQKSTNYLCFLRHLTCSPST